jgi:ABC-type transport system involved in multi-copper enzyme maturation permease subunit
LVNLKHVLAIARNSMRVSVRSRLFLAATAVLMFVVLLQLIAYAQGISGIYIETVLIWLLGGSGHDMAVLIPLLALVVAVPSISMDRANGTLRLVLSQGISDVEYVFGRVLGSVATIFLPILITMVAYAALVLGPYQGMVSSMGASRMVATTVNMGIMVVAYGSLGSLISVVTKRPLLSLLLGMVVFFFLGDLYQMIGRLVGFIAVGLSPGASSLEFVAQYGNYSTAFNAAMMLSPSYAAGALQNGMSLLSWGKPVDLSYYVHSLTYIAVLAGYTIASLFASLLLFRRVEK